MQSTKPGLKRKVLLFHSYVMNQISQMLIITLDGLTLVLQSMFQIKLVDSERYIHLGERANSHVEAIETCSLELSSDFVL